MPIKYKDDIVVWAAEQARLIRARQFDQLDIEHIADEIEDVGKSEKRELLSRVAVLLAHLIKWEYQPGFRSRSWQLTITEQRKQILRQLRETPSLKSLITDNEWIETAWSDAVILAIKETGLESFPEICPWTLDYVINGSFPA